MAEFKPLNAATGDSLRQLPHQSWLPILQHSCDFQPSIFESVALNLIKNPNINSSLLFRADVLYDSLNNELTSVENNPSELHEEALQKYRVPDGTFPGFKVKRSIIRVMVPRNPQLDRPIAQTCQFLHHTDLQGREENLVIYIPHASRIDELPWYHPRVQSVAYLHTWHPQGSPSAEDSQVNDSQSPPGNISLHYRLFPSEALPLHERLLRTAYHLLSVVHKHGQGSLAGYKKRVHHDQVISQQRAQDTYTELKLKHAKRLCDNWVEQTEPSKHVYEDLGIAAFLIELWKDMYQGPDEPEIGKIDHVGEKKPSFPGFVDIGCGNGVLVDVLVREGYQGWGFDARKRKTWATFEPATQKHLKELILIPQTLFEMHSTNNHANGGILYRTPRFSETKTSISSKDFSWHNGIFPTGTFIISNHADELSSWTPLLASISSSPFLAIPCCSHNLSGLRFRAPSVFNSYSADSLAPSYFAANITKSKAVAIKIACPESEEDQPIEGDLNDLSIKSRSKQQSAYASLCDWISHLTAEVGYVVEKEMLRLPTTRNMGILGRTLMQGFEFEDIKSKMERVKLIASKEKADGVLWVQRAKGLVGGQGLTH